jgi:hypothetical protein
MSQRFDIARGLFTCLTACLMVNSGLVVGCDFQHPVCVSDAECRSGFVCSSSSGYCEPDWDALSQGDARSDVSQEEDTQPAEDTSDAEEEVGTDTFIVPSACVGEVDDQGCSSRGEPNDSPQEAAELTASGFGCTGEGTGFRELDTVKSVGICGADSIDYYTFEYVECRDRSFRIDVIVDPRPETCPHDIYSLSIELDGARYECSPEQSVSNSDARCTTFSDGGRQLTAYIEAQSSPSVQFATIVIASEVDSGSAFFNYDMRVRLD